jgi:hypothetical protein
MNGSTLDSVVLCARTRKQGVLIRDAIDSRRIDPSIHLVVV